MQHLFLVIFTFLSALNVYAYPSYGPGKVSVGKYQKPGKGDQRCVCPALNTLSNYGYLNRNGQGLTVDAITAACTKAFHTDDAFGRGLSINVFNEMGLGVNGTMDLAEMAGSGAMHAANLFHTDKVLRKGTDQTTDKGFYEALVADAGKSPYIDVHSLAKTRLRVDRISQKGGQPAVPSNPKAEAPAVAEASAMLLVFGSLQKQVIGQKPTSTSNGTAHKIWLMPKDTANDWLVQNKIPKSWKPSPTLVGTADLGIIEDDLIKQINADGGKYPPLAS